MKKLALISTFCNTQEKIDTLKNNLIKLKKLNVDTLIFTPNNLLPSKIIELSTHCIITNENPILDTNMRTQLIFKKPASKHKIRHTFVLKDYGWASLNQQKRLFSYGSQLEYDIFYPMHYDLEITSEIESIINSNVTNFFFGNNKKGKRSKIKGVAGFAVACIFGILDKVNCKIIESEITLKKYLKYISAEKFYEAIQQKMNLPIHDYITTDSIFNNVGIDRFNISPTNKLSMFIDNSFNFRENNKEVGIHFYEIGKSCQVVIGDKIITIDKEQIIFTNEPTIIVDGYVVNTIFEKFPLREIKIDDNNDWNYIKNYKFNK